MTPSPRLLIVEDEPAVREIVGEYLRGRGAAVEEAGTLAAARERLAATRFDLVLSDVRLPDGEGVDLLLESRTAEAPVPFVMMSAYATAENAIALLGGGAIDLLLKPFRLRDLHATVQRALERARTERARGRDAAAGRWFERLWVATEAAEAPVLVAELVGMSRQHLGPGALEVVDGPAPDGWTPLGAARAARAVDDPHLRVWLAALDATLRRLGA